MISLVNDCISADEPSKELGKKSVTLNLILIEGNSETGHQNYCRPIMPIIIGDTRNQSPLHSSGCSDAMTVSKRR